MLIGLLVFFALVKLAAIDRTLDEMSGGLIIQLLAFLPLIWFLLYHLNGKLDFRFFFRKHLTGIRWKQLIVVGLSLWVFTFGLEGVQLALIRWISPNLAGGWEEGPIYLGDQPMILNLLNIMLAVVVGPL
ncbi:MAG: hypothetical protein KDC53_05675, partial [Saprospiraceae bacterium]|nr:hypothetical protein [Saprospiraceae bacterium]